MVTRQICSNVDVQERDDFDQLIHDLNRHSATTLTIDIGAEVDVLTMPGEFEELVDAARSHGVSLEIATEDPVRQELARIYGIRVVTGPEDDPTAIFRELETRRLPQPAPPAVQRDDPEVLPRTEEFFHVLGPHGDRAFSGDLDRLSPFETGASFSFVVAPPPDKVAPRRAKSRPEPRNRGQSAAVSRSLGWGSVVVSGMAIVAAVATLLIALLAPSAAIVVVPETRAITAEVTYGLPTSDQPLDVEISPEPLRETISFQATVPATGEMLVPDGRARGMVFVTNPSSQGIELPAGTVFSKPDGSGSYVSIEPIDIPAADPFGSAQFGTAVVEVEATEAGPAGNLGVGELSGELDSGVLFQNRFPVGGGTNKTVSVVTEADIEALRAAAAQEFAARAASALDSQVPSGWVFSDAPKLAGDITTAFTAEAGTIADEVRVDASADVVGSVYDPSALEAAASDYLLQTLAARVPEGFALVVDSVRTTVPDKIASQGSVAFVVSAEAVTEAQFDSGFSDQLRGELVGKGEERATETLEGIQNVSEYTVSYGPEWLPWKPIPRFEERISIEIDGS